MALTVLAGDLATDRRYLRLAGLATLGLLCALSGTARAEEPGAPNAGGMAATAVAHPANPQPQIQAQPPAMVRGMDPGFLDAVGRWIDWSMEDFNTRMKAAHGQFVAFGEAGRRATDSAGKELTDSLPKLPVARVVAGRERCEITPNGAPDCQTAVEAMCRTGGFSTGRSLDTQAVQKCPARVWLSGRMPQAGECSVEAFVNRALCQ